MFEKFIEALLQLVAALHENTKAIRESSGPTAVAPSPEPEKAKTKVKDKPAEKPADKAVETTATTTITVQDLRNAAQTVLDANGNDPTPLVALAKEFGTKRITEVPAEKYAEMLGRLQKLATDVKSPV